MANLTSHLAAVTPDRIGPEPEARRPAWVVQPPGYAPAARPNPLVRAAFYWSIFAIPFLRLYIPGTGERLGVTRLVQGLVLLAALSQPRFCLRRLPVALLVFFGYYLMRIGWGLGFSPNLAQDWWPTTLDFLQYLLPWSWFVFNVLQYPSLGRRGLQALAAGCALCAMLHLAGVGTAELDTMTDDRVTIFAQNANVAGAIYAMGLIAIIGLLMLGQTPLGGRLLMFPLLAIVAAGLAKTGSRTAALIVCLGLAVLLFQSRAFVPRLRRYIVLALIAGMLAGVVYQIPIVYKRLQRLGSHEVSTHEARGRMIPVLWEIFLRHPVSGSGPSSYQAEMTRRALPEVYKQGRLIASHNLSLLVLVETGLIGLAVYAGAMGLTLKAALRARHSAAGFVPLAMFLPLLIAGLTTSDPSANPVFWLATAYALAGRG